MLLAGIALLLTVLLGWCSLFLATWRSPRTNKVQALVDVVMAVARAYREFSRDAD